MEGLAKSLRLDTGDLIQQIALLSWFKKDGDDNHLYEMITGLRVGYELWNRLSGQDEIEMYRTQTIGAIADYIKKHPKASEQELANAIAKEIQEFANKVEAM